MLTSVYPRSPSDHTIHHAATLEFVPNYTEEDIRRAMAMPGAQYMHRAKRM